MILSHKLQSVNDTNYLNFCLKLYPISQMDDKVENCHLGKIHCYCDYNLK